MAGSRDREVLSRDRIVKTAQALIVEGGLEALSLRRLAAELDVSATALYAHVHNKEDLLRAVAEREFEHLVAAYEAVESADPLARIRFHSRTYASYARANPELFKVMLLFPPQQSIAEVPPGSELPAATAAFAWAVEAVTDAIDAGLIVTDDPPLVTLTLWAGAHGAATVLQLGFELPRQLEDALIDEVTDRILAGYRA
jgi:AcrR family transcriptional regulator